MSCFQVAELVSSIGEDSQFLLAWKATFAAAGALASIGAAIMAASYFILQKLSDLRRWVR
jgi:hypothetical protein